MFLFTEINAVAFNGNLFVFYAVYRNKRLRIISNIFSCCSSGSEWRLDISRLVVCHFQLSQLLEAVGILVNFFASLMALLSVFAFGLVSLYTMGVIAISRYFRVAKGFFPWRVMGSKLIAWCVIWPKLVAWGVNGHSSVMRDLLFLQGIMGGFPLKFQYHQKLEAGTLKIDSYETKDLLFFSFLHLWFPPIKW